MYTVAVSTSMFLATSIATSQYLVTCHQLGHIVDHGHDLASGFVVDRLVNVSQHALFALSRTTEVMLFVNHFFACSIVG
jgi:hypothetical protein